MTTKITNAHPIYIIITSDADDADVDDKRCISQYYEYMLSNTFFFII